MSKIKGFFAELQASQRKNVQNSADSDFKDVTSSTKAIINFRVTKKNQDSEKFSLFTLDDEGDEDFDEEMIESTASFPKKTKKKRGVNIPDSILDDPEINELMEKAVVKEGFDEKPVEEVLIKSKRRIKKDRKAVRAQTMGADWFDMPATELTEERKMDLELLQLRNSLDPNVHYRRNDRTVLPKYFQFGKIVDNQADFYSSRMTKKERKRTMVEELMQDYELLSKHKKKYDQIRVKKAKAKRGVGFLKRGQASKNKRRQARKG